jgi:hypothetical protein
MNRIEDMLHQLGVYYRNLFKHGHITKNQLNTHLGRLQRHHNNLERQRNTHYNASVRTSRTRTASNRTRHS